MKANKRIPKIMTLTALAQSLRGGTKRLALMVGVPASGKSSLAEELERAGFYRLCNDKIRLELYGDEAILGGDEVRALMLQRYAAALLEGRNIVLDNMYTNRFTRRARIQKARQAGYEVIVLIMATPLSECLSRNRNRDRVVPEELITEQHAELMRDYPTRSEARLIEVKPGPTRDQVSVLSKPRRRIRRRRKR